MLRYKSNKIIACIIQIYIWKISVIVINLNEEPALFQHILRNWIKTRKSELMSELCKSRGKEGKKREQSSFSINGCGGYVSVPLWNFDKEGNWGNDLFRNLRVQCLYVIGEIEVLIGLLNFFSLYSSICNSFFKVLTREAWVWFK